MSFARRDWISARTVLWGAGVAASPLARTMGVPLDRAGRVRVTPALTVPQVRAGLASLHELVDRTELSACRAAVLATTAREGAA